MPVEEPKEEVRVQSSSSAPGSSAPGWIVFIVTFGVILASIGKAVFNIGEPRLEIVAGAEQTAEKSWNIQGRVLLDGAPVDTKTVWAIVADEQGNRRALEVSSTNTPGGFSLTGIPASLSNSKTPGPLQAGLFARALMEKGTGPNEGRWVLAAAKPTGAQWIEGQESITLGERGGTRWVPLPLWAVVPLLSIFFASIALALLRFPPSSSGLKTRYYGSIGLALALTVAMITYLAMGLHAIHQVASKGEVLALGFANVFHGQYAEKIEPEWLLSFTAPNVAPAAAAAQPVIEHGFGAPLWMLFMSVIGSGIFTVLIVIRGIKEAVDFSKCSEVSDRVEEIVRHQFYILFSPVGAIFVYQFLLAAGMATQPVTVALIALAAGVTLNLLLDKALAMTQDVIQSSRQTATAAAAASAGSDAAAAAAAAKTAAEKADAAKVAAEKAAAEKAAAAKAAAAKVGP